MRKAALLALLALAAPAAALAAPHGDIAPPEPQPIAWRPGPGRALVEQRCLLCHNGELIAQQRLTPPQWEREVAKMVKWGAPLTAPEQRVLAAYLAEAFPADAPPAKPASIKLRRP